MSYMYFLGTHASLYIMCNYHKIQVKSGIFHGCNNNHESIALTILHQICHRNYSGQHNRDICVACHGKVGCNTVQ